MHVRCKGILVAEGKYRIVFHLIRCFNDVQFLSDDAHRRQVNLSSSHESSWTDRSMETATRHGMSN